jgi:PHP family Zn ribbon phosphoesterase
MSQVQERTIPTALLPKRVLGIERGWADLPRYQTRTCVHCGRHTAFVLEDAIGDWYRCLQCGAYA